MGFNGYHGDSVDLTVNSVIIEGNYAQYMGAGIYLDTDQGDSINAKIYDSIIRNNQSDVGGGIYARACGGESSVELLVVNSLIYGNQADWSGGGITLVACEEGDNNAATIINSTISDNWLNGAEPGHDLGGAGIDVLYSGDGAEVSLDILNSIVYGNTLPGEQAQDLAFGREGLGNTTVSATACDIGAVHNGNQGTPIYDPFEVISADPEFSDPAGGDYHLTPGSQCIDSGILLLNPPGLPLTDIEGNPRIVGPKPDIGAYEYTGTPPPPPTVSSVAPGSGNQGQTLDVSITGTNLNGATAVSFGAGITINSFSVAFSTLITANITIAPGAALGPRDVSVTTPAGTGALAGGFTVRAEQVEIWNCPLGGVTLIAPNPGAGRPFLTVAVDCDEITVSAGAELWGIYYLDETAPGGEWLYYIPGFVANTLTQLEPDKYYYVVVSDACTLTIPQEET
jgi:hypothetical protein